jgi:Domain of unknown function (DUF4326)
VAGVGSAGALVTTNPADTLLIPLIAERRPVWRGRPYVNGYAVPAAVVESTARVTCGLGTARFRPPSLTKRETEVQMCRVLNKHAAGRHDGAIYIGRGSKWGNPFRIGVDGDRAAVIVKHARWLRDQHHLLRALDELRGKNLLCFCAPAACHGDLLLRLANATREERIAWWRSAA